tara:strand:+ start:577 stop:1710 length:1134 start_codon:yes stop_codon:yes gene_type:complete
MAQTPQTPAGFSSEYDKICYRHSSQVTADANEFTEVESRAFSNLVDPIKSWKEPRRWLRGPFYSYQINKCKREGTPCTPLQELVFKWINTYAASRPTGAPAFVCHTRRSTGDDKRVHTRGEIITAWQKQVVAASPPSNGGCYPAQPAGSAMKTLEGKCYQIIVPQNSTYLVVDEKKEVLFPAGCVFRVLNNETPGRDIEVTLIQHAVIAPAKPFWGHVDVEQRIDEWWNGTIELLRKTYTNGFWEAADLELPNKTTVSLDTNEKDDEIIKERVCRNMYNSTIAYVNPDQDFKDDSVYGSRVDQLKEEIDILLITRDRPDTELIRTRKNAWKATGGLDIMTAFNLTLKQRDAKASFTDMCFLFPNKAKKPDGRSTGRV